MTEFEFQEPDFLGDELRMVRQQVRRFVEERIVPFGEAWEAAGEIPRQLFRDFGELGFLGMRHPVEYGGGGLGAMAPVVLGEELSRSTFGGVASALTVHSDMPSRTSRTAARTSRSRTTCRTRARGARWGRSA